MSPNSSMSKNHADARHHQPPVFEISLRLSPAAHSRSAHSLAPEASRFSRRAAPRPNLLHYGK